MDKNRRNLAIAVLVTAVLVGGVAYVAGVYNEDPEPTYNLVQVYVTNWDTNSSQAEMYDIQFRISIDANNDGTFEYMKTSDVIHGTNYELAPYRTGGLIPTDIQTFRFKIEVFRIVDNAQVPQFYTDDATVPLNTGTNALEASHAWDYDATASHPADPNFCRAGYYYYVT